MTKDEILQTLTLIKVSYPSFARTLTKRDADALVSLWEYAFGSYPAQIVGEAVKDLIMTKKDFAPDIATVKEKADEMIENQSFLQAWDLGYTNALEAHKEEAP